MTTWPGLVDRLVVVLASFEPGLRVIISSVTDAQRVVQFARNEDRAVNAECPGPTMVPTADWSAMGSLTWSLDEGDGFYRTSVSLPGSPGRVRQLAEDSIVLLRDVFGLDAARLEYQAWREPATITSATGTSVLAPGVNPYPIPVLGLPQYGASPGTAAV